MTHEEWENWKISCLNYFEEHFQILKNDIANNGLITRKSELTSLLYFFNRCNFDAGVEIIASLEEGAIEGDVLSHYLLGHIYMYRYKGMQVNRNLYLAREHFRIANELNPNFKNKQNP